MMLCINAVFFIIPRFSVNFVSLMLDVLRNETMVQSIINLGTFAVAEERKTTMNKKRNVRAMFTEFMVTRCT